MFKDSLSLEHFRYRLADSEPLPQLVLLGLLSGVVTALVIILFRLLIEIPLAFTLPIPNAEAFESLPTLARIMLPIAGSILLLLIYRYTRRDQQRGGVVHVLERMGYHQGQLPLGNLVIHFFGAATALISGHSVGREGPAVHIGAACSSLLGQWLKLPNNALRLLVGCGTSAAIAAAFNTPLAGVIFAMEVVMLEYTVAGFTPILVAAVTASLTVQLILSDIEILQVPSFTIVTLHEIPFIMLLGITIGLLAAFFNRLLIFIQQHSTGNISHRFLLAGLLTGFVAIFYPQIMGVGYDTVSSAINGEFQLNFLVGLLIAKILLTPIVLGLGIPGGLIGPTLFVGAIAGAIMGVLGDGWSEQDVSEAGFYAMLGMGAMMGAVLNAPLAALIALLELTGNSNIIFPGMLTIVIANTTVRFACNTPPIFLSILRAQGLDYRFEPLSIALSHVAIASRMESNILPIENLCSATIINQIRQTMPAWIVIPSEKGQILLRPDDLLQYAANSPAENYHLLDIPAVRLQSVPLNSRATLKQALDSMNHASVDAIEVQNHQNQMIGVITRQQIENYLVQS